MTILLMVASALLALFVRYVVEEFKYRQATNTLTGTEFHEDTTVYDVPEMED